MPDRPRHAALCPEPIIAAPLIMHATPPRLRHLPDWPLAVKTEQRWVAARASSLLISVYVYLFRCLRRVSLSAWIGVSPFTLCMLGRAAILVRSRRRPPRFVLFAAV